MSFYDTPPMKTYYDLKLLSFYEHLSVSIIYRFSDVIPMYYILNIETELDIFVSHFSRKTLEMK